LWKGLVNEKQDYLVAIKCIIGTIPGAGFLW
jgi:hypothetical protein